MTETRSRLLDCFLENYIKTMGINLDEKYRDFVASVIEKNILCGDFLKITDDDFFDDDNLGICRLDRISEK